MEELLMQMQQNRKAQEAQTLKRRAVVRIAVILLILLLALRILGVAQGGLLPVGVAIAEGGNGATTHASASSPTVVTRVEWLSYCDATRMGLGVYAPTDIPCSPSRIISFPALQSDLTTVGILTAGEYLMVAPAPLSPACRVVVVNEATSQLSGWLCADVNGLYRTAADGQNPGAQWQLRSDGSWVKG